MTPQAFKDYIESTAMTFSYKAVLVIALLDTINTNSDMLYPIIKRRRANCPSRDKSSPTLQFDKQSQDAVANGGGLAQ